MARPLLSPLRLFTRLRSSPLQPLLRSHVCLPSSHLLRPRHPSLRALTTSARLHQSQHDNPAADNEPPENSNSNSSDAPAASWPLPLKLLALISLIPISQYIFDTLLRSPPEKNDAPSSTPVYPTTPAVTVGKSNPITDNEDNPISQIPTTNAAVPFFPRKIYLPSTPSPPATPSLQSSNTSATLPAGATTAAETEEYILLGLGIRRVSFLRIQVYVVGLYVAKSDLARLQEGMIHAVASEGASTLISSEKEELKKKLLDAEGSEEIWTKILSTHGKGRGRGEGAGGIRSALRIVPVRDTNMGHMRDGFVRMIEAGGKGEGVEHEAGFRESVQGFRAVMGGASKVGKGKVLLLGRGREGEMDVWAEGKGAVGEEQPGKEKAEGSEMVYWGGVRDERVARAIWMGYLAGANVATEGARESVVDGVLDLVGRPIGTVETQVI